jgi:aspartate aminotransferase-like enzyme
MRDLTIYRTARFAKRKGDPAHASATVSALEPVIDADTLRGAMKQRGFTLGGGYGQWKDSTFRIGHMGDIPLESLETMLDALSEIARG